MRNRIVFLLGILILLITGCSKADTNIFSKREKDIQFVYDTLSDKHFNLYAVTSKFEYEKERDKLLKKSDSLSDAEFYHALEEFVAFARDGYTYLFVDHKRVSPFEFQKELPFAVHNIGGKWYLIGINSDNQEYIGSEFIKIEGVSVSEVLDKAKKLKSYDTEAIEKYYSPAIIRYLDVLNYLGITEREDGVEITVIKDGVEETLDLSFINYSEGNTLELFKRDEAETFPDNRHYRVMELSPDMLFIQYNTTKIDSDYPIDEFIEDIENHLSSGEYKKIVVDMRYNSGTETYVFQPVKEVIAKANADNEYELYCLIGIRTHFSGIVNSIDMVEIGAKLVGTSTGGAMQAFVRGGQELIPNSPFVLVYPTERFEFRSGYGTGSLEPDILFEESYEGFFGGRDELVESIVNDEI